VDAIQQMPRGWTLVLACGPNELSLEDPDWGQHGIFYHFLAAGLRGDADLDRDGVVSLGELTQYLANRISSQAGAVIEQWEKRGLAPPLQNGQTRMVMWGGPIAFPLTRRVDEQRVGLRPGVLPLWARFLWRPMPYAFAVESMVRYGVALLYGLVMALTVWVFAARTGQTAWEIPVAVVGIGSGLIWIAAYALAGAANEMRWHAGGYVSASLTLVWHLAVSLFLVALNGDLTGTAFEADTAVFWLVVDLVILSCVMVVFGHNAVQCIIALADMVKRDLRVAGRRAFVQLEQQWINADIDNVIAMTSAHPKLYYVAGLVGSVLAVAHALYVLATKNADRFAAVQLSRDFALLVLIQWQVNWFGASYRKLRGILLPEK
jgi:hypothetical protein